MRLDTAVISFNPAAVSETMRAKNKSIQVRFSTNLLLLGLQALRVMLVGNLFAAMMPNRERRRSTLSPHLRRSFGLQFARI